MPIALAVFETHHHLEPRRLLDRQIGGLGTASHPIYELGDAPEQRSDAPPVTQQSGRIHQFAENKHGQNAMPKREVGKAGAIVERGTAKLGL